MKAIHSTTIVIYLISTCMNAFGQNNINFENDVININSGTASCNCNYTNIRLQPSSNIPSSNSVVKIVKIDFNIFQDGAGTGNFQNNSHPQHGLPRLNYIHSMLNNFYSHNAANSLPPSNVIVNDLPHEFVQFELGNIYFYNDPAYFKDSNGSSLMGFINSDPLRSPTSASERLQIFFSEGWASASFNQSHILITNGGSGYTSTPTVTFDPPVPTAVVQITGGVVTGIILDPNNPNFSRGVNNSTNDPNTNYGFPTITITGGGGSGATAIITGLNGASAQAPRPDCVFSNNGFMIVYGAYNGELPIPTDGDYAAATLIAHEMGHNLDLIHTYTGGGTIANCTSNSSDPTYMEDIYGLPAPGNCPHNVAWDCALISTTNKITNNMMGGNQCASYFSPNVCKEIFKRMLL